MGLSDLIAALPYVVLIPASVAAALGLLARWLMPRATWPAPAATALGYVAGHVSTLGWPRWSSMDASYDWFPLAAMGVALVAIVESRLSRAAPQAAHAAGGPQQDQPQPVRGSGWLMRDCIVLLLRAGVAAIIIALVARPLKLQPVSARNLVWLAGATFVVVVFWSWLAWALRRTPSPVALPGLLVLLTGGSLTLLWSHVATVAQIQGVLASLTGALLVTNAAAHRAPFVAAAMAVVATLAPAQWISGYLYSDLPPRSVALLAAAAAPLGIPLLPGVRQFGAWRMAAIVALATAGMILPITLPAYQEYRAANEAYGM